MICFGYEFLSNFIDKAVDGQKDPELSRSAVLYKMLEMR